MRTKALLLTAALGAVGLTSAMAQVYSINAVGFVTVDIPKGFLIVANPLKAESNKTADLFKGVPEGFTVYKFNPATGYSINAYELGDWSIPNETMMPGEGAFVLNPADTAVKVVFVGEVMQGDLSHDIPKGLSIQSSEVPQKGKITTDLKFPATDGDLVYRFRRGGATGYSIFAYELGSWDPEPEIDIAEGFFVNKAAATKWTRTFSVNQ